MAGKIEDEYAGNFLEQARHCLRDGSYEKAISLLGRAERLRPTMNGISELLAIAQVCHAAAWKCSCRMQAPTPKNPDWYRVLKVEERADSTTIRKRYRQLALLLHPDKNKNAKSEEAFKLISEAYACLSDRILRRSFDIERSKSYCSRCYLQEPSSRRKPEGSESDGDYLKSEQDRLQMFREKARARVTSLAQDIRTRRSRWNADLESARERIQNKRVDRKSMFSDIFERPLRESDVFQPSLQNRNLHFAPESDLMSILRGRRTLERERSQVSQSLDGLLNRLKRESKEEAERFRSNTCRTRKTSNFFNEVVTPESSNPFEGTASFTDGQFSPFEGEWSRRSSDVTNRFFFKRVSSLAETLPARKLFREEEELWYPVEPRNTDADISNAAAEATSSSTLENLTKTVLKRAEEAAKSEVTPQSKGINHNLRGKLVGDEDQPSVSRTEYTESLFCCGSRKSVLKEQRQKSEELLKTLERLRQEAKSVAATLDKLKRRSSVAS